MNDDRFAHNPDYPEQLRGYCSYLRYGDWMSPEGNEGMLWDSVKMCAINRDVSADPQALENQL